jgi:hypothetical protein
LLLWTEDYLRLRQAVYALVVAMLPTVAWAEGPAMGTCGLGTFDGVRLMMSRSTFADISDPVSPDYDRRWREFARAATAVLGVEVNPEAEPSVRAAYVEMFRRQRALSVACDSGAVGRDRTAYRLGLLGYSVGEILQVITGRASRAELDRDTVRKLAAMPPRPLAGAAAVAEVAVLPSMVVASRAPDDIGSWYSVQPITLPQPAISAAVLPPAPALLPTRAVAAALITERAVVQIPPVDLALIPMPVSNVDLLAEPVMTATALADPAQITDHALTAISEVDLALIPAPMLATALMGGPVSIPMPAVAPANITDGALVVPVPLDLALIPMSAVNAALMAAPESLPVTVVDPARITDWSLVVPSSIDLALIPTPSVSAALMTARPRLTMASIVGGVTITEQMLVRVPPVDLSLIPTRTLNAALMTGRAPLPTSSVDSARITDVAALTAPEFPTLTFAAPARATPKRPAVTQVSTAARASNPTPAVIDWWTRYYALAYGVDYRLVAAIIRQESNWQLATVSSKGALGLMQLMPATAAMLKVNPHDPIDNLRGGIAYLASLLSSYRNVRSALIAYNAGPSHADQVLRGERQPYAETQRYLSAVGAFYPLESKR